MGFSLLVKVDRKPTLDKTNFQYFNEQVIIMTKMKGGKGIQRKVVIRVTIGKGIQMKGR